MAERFYLCMFRVKMPHALSKEKPAVCTWESQSPKISHPALKSVKRLSFCQSSGRASHILSTTFTLSLKDGHRRESSMSALMLAFTESNMILQNEWFPATVTFLVSHGKFEVSHLWYLFEVKKTECVFARVVMLGRRGGGGDFWSKERSAKYLVIFDRKRRPPRADTKGSHGRNHGLGN